jgi:hypothetical protein
MITIFKNIYASDPHYIPVEKALERITSGKSKNQVNQIRATLDKDKANNLKMNLPSVCFSGKFSERKDDCLITHSKFIVLDFDEVPELRDRQNDIITNDFVYACWISPRANGLKALVRIADGKKHREHFQALQDIFPEVDKSGINPSRVCFESYDPDMYVNKEAKIFTIVKSIEQVTKVDVVSDDYEVFKRLLKWLTNRHDAFVSGERNSFIFKLASACCRFGLHELTVANLISNEFLSSSDFTRKESDRAIRSAYKTNAGKQGTCAFQNEQLVEKNTKKEVVIDAEIFDPTIKPKDVIYGIDVKEKALLIHERGYEKVAGINVSEIDTLFKPKRGEITLFTGIGNYGKTAFKKWYQTMRILIHGEKFATFSPEDNPPEEYYHDFVEILLGTDCTPRNPHNPSKSMYEDAYDFISKNVFYVYPKDVQPTPEYIFERFLELIIKEKVDGVDIDPFNQLANDYGKQGRTDKYLETFLSYCSRFGQVNNVYFWIIAHPKLLSKGSDGNYPCPDVFDVADGAMWNNKMDNILVYHRPFAQTAPQDPTCELYSKKIRRQKIVGLKGFVGFDMFFPTRRFRFSGVDPLRILLENKNLSFGPQQQEITFQPKRVWQPFKDGDEKELPF